MHQERAKSSNSKKIKSTLRTRNVGRLINDIDNIVNGVYDEYGEIYLDNDGFKGFVTILIKQVSPGQVIALGGTIFLRIIVMMYACYLHRALTYSGSSPDGKEWAPQKGLLWRYFKAELRYRYR